MGKISALSVLSRLESQYFYVNTEQTKHSERTSLKHKVKALLSHERGSKQTLFNLKHNTKQSYAKNSLLKFTIVINLRNPNEIKAVLTKQFVQK